MLDRNRIPSFSFHLWNKLHNWIAEPNLALLDQDHNARRSGHHFGQTREIKNRVDCHHLALWLDRPCAIRHAPNDFTVMANQHDRARQFFLID